MAKKIKLIGYIPATDATYRDYLRIVEEFNKAELEIPIGVQHYFKQAYAGNILKRFIPLQGSILHLKDIPVGVTTIRIIIDKEDGTEDNT